MRGMASPTTTPTTDAHEAEVAKQEEIAQEVAAADAPKTVPAAADEPQLVKLRSKGVEVYPLTVSVVGSDDIVFDSESAVKEVTPAVAEQVKYMPNVEVAE